MSKKDKYDVVYDKYISNFTADWQKRRMSIVLPEKNNDSFRIKYPTQPEFCKMIGLKSPAGYSKLELGLARPPRKLYKKVMKIFEKYGV